ncbi:MAG: integrase arm-type DNA-binding domain-containing protein [Gammaproteobacteria bacterium]|nr:integrase arm-type DNA-binding domain-containing protein [Gammaproteobacteria bacterium]
MLSDAKIKRLPAKTKAYRETDIPTLNLVVQKTGRKTFLQRLTIHGKQEEIRLGDWPTVSLADARKQADENRTAAKAGRDPRQTVAGAMTVPTFAEAQEKVIAIHRGNWREGGKTEAIWRREMNTYAGALLPLPVDQITVRHLENVLAPIWTSKVEISKRLKQRCSLILKWAYAHGYRDGNPADLLDMILPKRKHRKQHYKALPFADVAEALVTIEQADAWWATKAAFRFLILTAARSGEVRNMTWSELDGDTWTIDGSRMKSGREHKVKLSRQALAILDQAREYSDGGDLVFPSVRSKVQSSFAMSHICKECGIEGTPHGMRSAFRNYAAEKTSFPRAVAELCLAHVNDNETEAAYLRTDMLQARAALLQQWADYVTGERGKVVRIA